MPNARTPVASELGDTEQRLSATALVGIRRLTAIDTVRARIAMAVDLRLLIPGERLPPPSEIAEAMDVSEITVRRALTALARDGVLERRRGRNGGTLVAAHPTLGTVAEADAYRSATTEVHDLIDQRLLLECGVAHLAALSATKAQLAALKRLVRAMDRASTWAEFHTADEHFHIAVAEATGIPAAAAHRDLLDAMTARDPVQAVNVAHGHVATLHKTMFVGLTS